MDKASWPAAIQSFIERINNLFLDNLGLTFLIGGISLFVFFFSLFSLYYAIGKLPSDYFYKRLTGSGEVKHLPLPVKIIKNAAGAVVLVGGIAMLFIPGQGLLTILLGVLLINFPGKKRLEDGLLSLHTVERGLNYLRKRRHLEPFVFPDDPKEDSGET